MTLHKSVHLQDPVRQKWMLKVAQKRHCSLSIVHHLYCCHAPQKIKAAPYH